MTSAAWRVGPELRSLSSTRPTWLVPSSFDLMSRSHASSPRAGRHALRALLAAVMVCTPVAAHAQEAIGSEPPRDPRPFAALSNTALSMRDSIVALARAQIGTRYRLGGTSPDRGFDCSGFVRYVLGALKISLPRTAAQQAAQGSAVPKDTTRLRPGDLLTFGRGNRVTHIGIYVGNGRYVHASTTAGRVIETSLSRSRSPLVRAWRGGRRVLADAESDTSAAQQSP